MEAYVCMSQCVYVCMYVQLATSNLGLRWPTVQIMIDGVIDLGLIDSLIDSKINKQIYTFKWIDGFADLWIDK